MKNLIFVLFICVLFPISLSAQSKSSQNSIKDSEVIRTIKIQKLTKLTIDSSINPATLSYLETGFKEANEKDSQGILINMNTPGGLVSTTKKILNLIGTSEIPVIIWISPEGSSATSAGAIISSGAHLLYMSEGTNIGAATPVQMGQEMDEKSDLRQKSINDLVALVTSLSKSRGRNAKGFADMIENATSFDSQEALKENLIDGIINRQSDIKNIIHGKIVHIKGNDLKIDIPGDLIIENYEMDLGQLILNIFANPSLAYILFLIGAALIYFELQAPGGFIAGAVGVFFIVLAGIGFQVLPLNFGGLGLIILSFFLFILEAYITSYGVLSLAGIASLITGSLFLFRTNDSYLELSHTLIFSTTGAIAVFLAGVAWIFIKSGKNIGSEQFNSLIGKKAIVSEIINEADFIYQVKVGGEFWKLKSKKELSIGDEVEILEKDTKDMFLLG